MQLGDADDEGPVVDPESGAPIDLAALRADDALLDALGTGLVRPGDRPAGGSGSDDELVAMLVTWIAEVRPEDVEPHLESPLPESPRPEPPLPEPVATPVPPPVTTSSGRRWSWSAPPLYVRRLAAAAALVVLASSGLAVGAWDAVPGETLWAVSKVFYAERARSVEAAEDVTTGLARARVALQHGRRAEAARAIATVQARLAAVRPDEGQAGLAREHQRLRLALAASDVRPTPSSVVIDLAPLAADPPPSRPSRTDGAGGADPSGPPVPGPPVAPNGPVASTGPAPANEMTPDGPAPDDTRGGPGVAHPGPAQPSESQRSESQPSESQPSATQQRSTDGGPAWSDSARSGPTQPYGTERGPAWSDSTPSGPADADPAPADPTQSGGVPSYSAPSRRIEPDVAHSDPPPTTQPKAAQPKATQPKATHAKATQPKVTQPNATQPSATQHRPSRLGSIRSGLGGSDTPSRSDPAVPPKLADLLLPAPPS